jgi:hypothetical protein
MANTKVFTGADGSLTLSPSQGPEGDKANAVIQANDMLTVGRVQDVKVQVHTEIRAFNEIGQRYPTQLRAGNVSVTGTIGRAVVNGAMLKLLLGDASDSRPATSWIAPTFNVTLLAENAAAPGVRNTITLHDVKISDWNYTMPEDDFVLESIGFQALYISVQDEG